MGVRSARNIRWIEAHCRIPEGLLVGQPVKLTKHQRRWMGRIYDSPTRLFILSMGRKNGKTAFIAMLVLLHTVGPEAQTNSQLYSAAQSRDQAAIVFSLAAKMVRMNPDLSAHVQIRDTAKQLLCPELGTVYHALSADATTAYGLSPAFTVHDELGQVRGPRSELYEALETASAAQPNPLSVVISTQAPSDADLLSTLIDDGLSGGDPRIKVEFYSAPMDVDPFSDEAIEAANPHFGSFMNKAEVRRQAQDAKRLPSREAAYRNLILNQRVEARQPFVSRAIWEENGEAPSIKAGSDVWIALDLSAVADLTALVITAQSEGRWDVESTFWLPEYGIAEKSRNDRVPYDRWSQDGFLSLTPGSSVEYEYVASRLREVFDTYNVRAVAFDRWNIKFLKPWLEKSGFSEEEMSRFIEFGQGFQSMSPAIRRLEELLLSRKLKHGKHPVLTMCAANATIVTDPAGGRKFTKAKSTGRIDGIVALAMAVGVHPMAEEAPEYQVIVL